MTMGETCFADQVAPSGFGVTDEELLMEDEKVLAKRVPLRCQSNPLEMRRVTFRMSPRTQLTVRAAATSSNADACMHAADARHGLRYIKRPYAQYDERKLKSRANKVRWQERGTAVTLKAKAAAREMGHSSKAKRSKPSLPRKASGPSPAAHDKASSDNGVRIRNTASVPASAKSSETSSKNESHQTTSTVDAAGDGKTSKPNQAKRKKLAAEKVLGGSKGEL